MKRWFVTFEMPYGGQLKTFEVEAINTPAAAEAGQRAALAWAEHNDRPTTGHLAPVYKRCAPVPPGWVELMGRRSRTDGYVDVTVGPGSGAEDPTTGETAAEWQERKPLSDRLDIRQHSPTGFQWGYLGSGPAQLALAACALVVGDERALKVYHAIKDQLFARVQSDVWTLSASRLRAMIEGVEVERVTVGQP